MIKIPDEYVLFKHDDDWSAKFCETLTNCLADPTAPDIVAYHGIVINSNSKTRTCFDTDNSILELIDGELVNDKKMNLNSVIHLHFQQTDLYNLKADCRRYFWTCMNADLIDEYGDKYLTPIERAVLKTVMRYIPDRDKLRLLTTSNLNNDKKKLERVIKKRRNGK